MNVSVAGHLSSGKSTLIGQLLLRLGSISKKAIDANEKEAAIVNKRSFKYAWVVDKLPIERQRGMTVEMHVAYCQTSKYACAITDCPGHKKYIKNAIAGVAYADVLVLVLDASADMAEAGISKDGQAREHAQLAFMMGVRQVVVAVTKMDLAGYQNDRFDAISKEVLSVLKKIGFNPDKVPVVPLCGWTGDNVADRVKTTTHFVWYSGPTLLEAIDSMEPIKRAVDKPLRMPVQDVYKIPGVGPVQCGRIESGSLKVGQKVVLGPHGESAEVRALEVNKQAVSEAHAGQNVGFSIKLKDLERQPFRGCVVSDAAEPASEVSSFQIQAFITVPGNRGIGPGFTPIMDVHTSHTPCCFLNLVSKLDRKTGKEIEKDPKVLHNGDVAIIDVVPLQRLVVEPLADCPALGRFALRDGRQIVGFGVVKSVTKKQSLTKA